MIGDRQLVSTPVPLILVDFSSTGDWRNVGAFLTRHRSSSSSYILADVSRVFEHW